MILLPLHPILKTYLVIEDFTNPWNRQEIVHRDEVLNPDSRDENTLLLIRELKIKQLKANVQDMVGTNK
jgi:hypothetical protein